MEGKGETAQLLVKLRGVGLRKLAPISFSFFLQQVNECLVIMAASSSHSHIAKVRRLHRKLPLPAT